MEIVGNTKKRHFSGVMGHRCLIGEKWERMGEEELKTMSHDYSSEPCLVIKEA